MTSIVKSIWDYEGIANRDVLEDIELLGEKLAGKKVQHVNSTYSGGGVAEILCRLVPLMKSLNIDAVWNVIRGDDDFFKATKSFHNALHGKLENDLGNNPIAAVTNGSNGHNSKSFHVLDNYIENLKVIGEKWDDLSFERLDNEISTLTNQFHSAFQKRKEMFATYMKWNEINNGEIVFDDDIVFIHDPQPAALINAREKHKVGKWVWRCHIDLSTPDPIVWKFLRNFISKYDASIFSTPSFSRGDLGMRQFLVPPSIDPLSDKNKELSEGKIDKTMAKFGISRDKPIISQISRFDYLKDPLGVVDSYKIVKKHIDCQLILAGSLASDDPEGMSVYKEILKKTGGDKDIHILLLPPFSDNKINALQRASTVILQKSLKEGFGLTVSEALWKGKPIVASATGGIPLQVINNVTGFLTHTVEGTAYKIRYIFKNPEFAKKLGENGKEHVRNNFLITRHLRDYLIIMLCIQEQGKTIYL
jgi:trehalose synthase